MITSSLQKRVSETGRQYTGENDASCVVEWLNDHAREKSARRVAILISDLTTLCASIEPWEERTASAEQTARWLAARKKIVKGSLTMSDAVEQGLLSDHNTWPTTKLGRDYSRKAFRRAQAALARYSFKPLLISESPQAHRLGLCERPPSKNMYARLYGEDIAPAFRKPDRAFIVAMRSGGREKGEGHAVVHIIALTERGLIDRVRRCSCGTWFFARNVKMTHHTARCRHRDYKSTPEWREKRNRYMRDYYRRFQSPKAARLRQKGK